MECPFSLECTDFLSFDHSLGLSHIAMFGSIFGSWHIWRCPNMEVLPVIFHFNRIFHQKASSELLGYPYDLGNHQHIFHSSAIARYNSPSHGKRRRGRQRHATSARRFWSGEFRWGDLNPMNYPRGLVHPVELVHIVPVMGVLYHVLGIVS